MTKKQNFEQIEKIWELRWRARTDLLWLCKNVLNYTRVDPKVHGPMIQHLQQFPEPTYNEALKSDKILSSGQFQYTSWCDPYQYLQGARRKAIFFSRGYYKTTINTIAHSIQWMLNFPHIAMGTFFSTGDKAEAAIREIKAHFKSNKRLRELFPEYCPRTRIADWGTAKNFTLPNRDSVLERLGLPPRKEQSMTALSIDQAKAGYHFDIIKCSDLVEQSNVVTEQLRAYIKNEFALIPKMLVHQVGGKDGWIDIEGTFYALDDLHCNLVNEWQEEAQKLESHRWSIFVRGVFERNIDDPQFTPDEMLLPFKTNAEGKRIPTWPEVDPLEKLEAEEKDPREGGLTFACQRTLNIKDYVGSDRPFSSPPRFKTQEEYRRVPIAFKLMSVDLASTTNTKSNPTVITVAGFDRVGRCHIEEIQMGKWGPDETIDRIFATYKRIQPSPAKVIIEDYGYTHGLKPSIDRKSHMSLIYPPFHFIPADRTQKKVSRIVNALQPPYVNGDLYFVEPLSSNADEAKDVKFTLLRELTECTQLSTGKTDDVLDTLAYLFLAKQWFGPELLRGGFLQTKEAREQLQNEQYEKAKREMLFPTTKEAHFDPFSKLTGW